MYMSGKTYRKRACETSFNLLSLWRRGRPPWSFQPGDGSPEPFQTKKKDAGLKLRSALKEKGTRKGVEPSEGIEVRGTLPIAEVF